MIRLERAGAVLRLILDRAAKKNALTGAMYTALSDAIEEANADAALTVLLIEGQPGAFCAGNDLADFAAAALDQQLQPVLRFLRVLATNRLPLIAAVDGVAIGVGTTLLLHCDHVIASSRSVFAAPFVDLGLVPEAASSLLAPMAMGHLRAFELLAMGRRFSAAEAREAGLVSTVLTDEGVEAHALTIAQRLAEKPREALLITRALLRPDPALVLARIDHEGALFAERLRSPEAQAAFRAFFARGTS